MWGGIGSCVREVSGMWGMGVVWKSVWGECGGCVEGGKVCWDAERSGGATPWNFN